MYLIVFGNEGSRFESNAKNAKDAVLSFAKDADMNGSVKLKQKALSAMENTDDLIALFNEFAADYDKIQKIYKVDSLVYPRGVQEGSDGARESHDN